MRERGRGRFLVTASAAGLLAEADVAAYSVSKHAAVALTEWLAINHGDAGIDFHCLCPQGVRTPLLAGVTADESVTVAAADLLEPEQVADAVLAAFAAGRFLILPHPQVAGYEQRRATDRDRWLAGMRRLRSSVHAPTDQPPSESGATGHHRNAATEVGPDRDATAQAGNDNAATEVGPDRDATAQAGRDNAAAEVGADNEETES
jgi:hypothetical protein